MSPKRVEETQIATAADLSGNINYDYSFPTRKTPVGAMRAADDNWKLKAPIVLSDISADRHGSEVTTPDKVGGYPFKVRES
jgi:uncharacterized protein RhaS with RHS repeats